MDHCAQKKARKFLYNLRSRLCLFDIDGIVHEEFAVEGQTVNQLFYTDVLRCLREDVRRKRPEK